MKIFFRIEESVSKCNTLRSSNKLLQAKMKNIIVVLLVTTLFSCSLERRLSKAAQQNVLNNETLQTAHVGISIYEPATGKYWYNYQGDKYFVPASNTKIPTCYAAMKYLGDSLVGLRYQRISDSLLMIKSSGDPSFLHSDFKTQRVYSFLEKYKYVSFYGDLFTENFLGSGWTWNDFKEAYAAQRSDFPIYGNIVKFKWVNNNTILATPNVFKKGVTLMENLKAGFEIVKPWENNVFLFLNGNEKSKEVPFRPDEITIQSLLQDTLHNLVNRNFDKEGYAQSRELYFSTEKKSIAVPIISNYAKLNWNIIHSQPTDSLLKPMMHRSDNFFAEQSLLMVSNEQLGFMSDAKIIDTLLKTDFKDLPQKPRWVDGSGLSRYNLFSPKDFVFILNKMKTDFGMPRIKNILATGGEGTLSSYYKKDSTFIYAKTGTLSNVVALSGFLYTKKGKELIFSVLVNNHQGSATNVRRAVEKFIEGVRERN